MKKAHKYILYFSIPLLFIIALVFYKSFIVKGDGSHIKEGDAKKEKSGRRGGGSKPLPVSVFIADFHHSEEGLMSPGTLVSNDKVEVAGELSGRVVGINFKEGQFVRKGNILVRLNDDELQSQLKRAKYQYTLLEQKLERQKILLDKEAVSREEYDQVSTEFNVLKQDIEQLEIKIAKMKIKAPFDGVIGFRNISLGALLLPNSKIATIVDLVNLVLEFSIPEKYISNQLLGAKVSFTVGGMSRNFSAVIYAIDPEIDVKTRSITLRARYNNRDGALRPGMFAKVSMNTNKKVDNIYIPNESIVSTVKGRSIWIVRNGSAEMKEIITGTRTVDMMEILSGVDKGDTIITSGLMQLRDGMSVIPANI